MTFRLMANPPAPRMVGEVVDAEALADPFPAGLLPGEAAFEVDPGFTVAAGVRDEWLANGGGCFFEAHARWIEPDGRTRHDKGRGVQTALAHTADVVQLDKLGVDGIRRELLLAVLGEPPTEVDIEVNAEAAEPSSPGVIAEPPRTRVPALPLSEQARRNCSIRALVALIHETADPVDPAAILGLRKG